MVAQVSSLVTRMQALELEPAPPMLFDHILDATSGPRKEKKNWKSWFGWTGSFVQPRFVMGLITVAAMILILVYASGFTPSKLKKTDLSPVSAFRAANRQVHLTYARSVKYVNDLRVVYEIQSRLQPSNEPSPETSPMPEEQQPKSSNPQEKSQTTPKPGHSQARTVAMLATYVNHGWAHVQRVHAARGLFDVDERNEQERPMNCAVHSDQPATGYCRNCGKPMCPQCTREVQGALYCEPCLGNLLVGSQNAA